MLKYLQTIHSIHSLSFLHQQSSGKWRLPLCKKLAADLYPFAPSKHVYSCIGVAQALYQ